MITRRGLFKLLIAAPVLAAIKTRLPYSTPKLVTLGQINLAGIPYHQSDASTGTWMGITRTTTPEFRADYKFYSAQRPLLDMDNPFYKRLNNARRTL